jgi:hypothetical protein
METWLLFPNKKLSISSLVFIQIFYIFIIFHKMILNYYQNSEFFHTFYIINIWISVFYFACNFLFSLKVLE